MAQDGPDGGIANLAAEIDAIIDHPEHRQALTGVTREEFDRLVEEVERSYHEPGDR